MAGGVVVSAPKISPGTKRRVERAWRAFARAVIAAENEHGAKLSAYIGASANVCDDARLEASHQGKASMPGGSDYADGGSIVIHLPHVAGFTFDGGDF